MLVTTLKDSKTSKHVSIFIGALESFNLAVTQYTPYNVQVRSLRMFPFMGASD